MPLKRHRSEPTVEPAECGDTLEEKLRRPCLCKKQSPKDDRVSCFAPFQEEPLLGQLKSWLVSFQNLHKLDQDKYVPSLCFRQVVSSLCPKLAATGYTKCFMQLLGFSSCYGFPENQFWVKFGVRI